MNAMAETNEMEKWILYSTCDEDSNSELEALSLSEEDEVLSVTGSGCRSLSLLVENPKRLTSVDYSPGQSHLLELKLAAIRALNYDKGLAFFGVDDCSDRWTIFNELKKDLTPRAAAYFERHRKAIESGVLFAGRHEQFYVRFAAPMLRLLYGRAFKRIFAADSLEEQRRIYASSVNGFLWRALVRYGFSDLTIKLILNDDKYKITNDVGPAGEYILERLDHTFNFHLAKDNHWLSLMINGRYLDRSALPHFLLEENYEAIRRSTTDVRVVTANMLDYIASLPDGSIDKFSLSDITSCITREEFYRLMSEVARTSRENAKLCYRNFLARYRVPNTMKPRMLRNGEMSDRLTRDDISFVYTLEVASVVA